MDISGTLFGQIVDIVARATRFMRPYQGRVVSVDDLEVRGRVQCAVEELGWFTQAEAPWCEPVYRGGAICLPAVGDYVMVYFLGGSNARVVWDGLVGEVKGQEPPEHDSPKKRVLYSRDGKYIVHDESDNSIELAGFGDVWVNVDGKVQIDGSAVELNGNGKRFVTYAELNTAIQGLITTLNGQLASVQAGAAAAITAGGFWFTPLVIGSLSLDLSAAETQTIKTGG